MSNTTNAWFNIGIGTLSGLFAVGLLFVAIKKPWVPTYYQEVDGFNIDHSRAAIPIPMAVKTVQEKVNGVLFYLAKSTDINNTKYIVNLPCMQELFSIDNEIFRGAMDYIDLTYNTPPKKYTITEQFLLRFSLLFSDDASLSIINNKGFANQNHINFSKLKERIADKSKKMNQTVFISNVRKCYTIVK